MRRSISKLLLLLLFAGQWVGAAPCSTSGGGTALENAANGLSAGEWCDFDAAEVVGLGDLLAVTPGDDNDYVQWQHAAQWDPVNKLLVWIGYDYAPVSRATVVYQESTNTWQTFVGQPFDPGAGHNGHDYDQTVVDPATGNVYFRPRLSADVYRGVWNGSSYSWSSSAVADVGGTCGSGITGEDAVGMAWDASRDGIVLFTDAGSGDGAACFWDRATNTWSTDGTVSGNVGSFHQVAEYSPVAEVVWMHSYNSRDHWKNDGGVVTKLGGGAPFGLGCCGKTGAESTPDPVTGRFIVTRDDGGRKWYEYDIESDTWTRILWSMPPLPAGSDPANVRVLGGALPDHGVLLYIDSFPYEPNIYLYKHGTPLNPPGVTLSANPTDIAAGGNSDLTWTASNADSCTASDGWTGAKSTAGGTENIDPINATTTFTLTCSNADGSTQRSAVVNVVPPATVSLLASPQATTPGGSTTLFWSSTDATSCTASDGWTGSKATAGSEVIASVASETDFTLTCSGIGGQGQDTVTVTTDGDPGGTPLYAEGFEIYAAGQDPIDWTDTAAGNSMQTSSGFEVFDDGGSKVFGTSVTNQQNIHSHYTGAGAASWGNYELTGRFKKGGSGDGIGVTVLSDYPNSDVYYRLRTYANAQLHMASHGTSCTGDTQSGVIMSTGTWYRFKVQAQDSGAETQIRAKVWEEGQPEPASWQVDCTDASGSRRTTGTVGVWAVAGSDTGAKYWDDLAVDSIGAPPPPVLSADAQTLDSGTVGVAYSETVTASHGTAPYTWAVDSGSLPPGISLAANGTFSGTPTTEGNYDFVLEVTDDVSDTDTESYRIVIVDAAASQDWNARSTAPGVVLANRFDDLQADFCDRLFPQVIGTRANGDCHNGRESYYDRTIKASGNGSLRFDYNNCPTGGRCGEGFGGELVMLIEGYAEQFSGDIPGQSEMWVQWRQRWSQNVIDTKYNTSAGNGQSKLIIIAEGLNPNVGATDISDLSSCSTDQTVVSNLAWNYWHARTPSSFHSCQGYSNITSFDGTNITHQNWGDLGPGPWPCQRWPIGSSPDYGTPNTCKWLLPEQWITIMVHMSLGPSGYASSSIESGTVYGFTDSTFELYMGYEGEALELVHRVPGIVFKRGQSSTSRFGAFRFLPHMTDRTGESLDASEQGSTWYDEIIISRQQIADPSGGAPPPVDTTPPDAPTDISLTPD